MRIWTAAHKRINNLPDSLCKLRFTLLLKLVDSFGQFSYGGLAFVQIHQPYTAIVLRGNLKRQQNRVINKDTAEFTIVIGQLNIAHQTVIAVTIYSYINAELTGINC